MQSAFRVFCPFPGLVLGLISDIASSLPSPLRFASFVLLLLLANIGSTKSSASVSSRQSADAMAQRRAV